MSSFYKMEPLKWDRGTDDLSLEQEAAYLRVVNAINAADQPIRANHRLLAGMWRCNERKAKRLLGELIKAGKVTIEDGWIFNRKAMEDVSNRRELSVKRASSGHSGGIESGKSRSKTLKNKETNEANASSRIEENRREEKKEPPLPPEGERGEAKKRSPAEKPARFDEFWEVYPHRAGKKGRAPAEQAYRRALSRGTSEQEIIDGARRERGRPEVIRGFARDPRTWLTQMGWQDEIGPSGSSPGTPGGGYWTSMGFIQEGAL